jgi:hypothetical protein
MRSMTGINPSPVCSTGNPSRTIDTQVHLPYLYGMPHVLTGARLHRGGGDRAVPATRSGRQGDKELSDMPIPPAG